MANAHRGETCFEVDGRTYRLHFTWNAAAEYEDVAKRPLSEALADLVREQLSATSMRAMLWAGLQEHHHPLSLRDAGLLIDLIGRRETQRVMGVALRYYFPELEDPPADPPSPVPSA